MQLLKAEKRINKLLTLNLPNKLPSAQFLICFNFQSALMMLKVSEHVVWVSNSLDQCKMLSFLISHPDPSCLHMAL